jgi:hypothetical protein
VFYTYMERFHGVTGIFRRKKASAVPAKVAVPHGD